MIRTSCVFRPELPLEPSYGYTSQVTEAEKGSAECLIVVTDNETDLNTSIECLMAFPVKVVPGEMLLHVASYIILFCVWSIETLFRACLRAG